DRLPRRRRARHRGRELPAPGGQPLADGRGLHVQLEGAAHRLQPGGTGAAGEAGHWRPGRRHPCPQEPLLRHAPAMRGAAAPRRRYHHDRNEHGLAARRRPRRAHAPEERHPDPGRGPRRVPRPGGGRHRRSRPLRRRHHRRPGHPRRGGGAPMARELAYVARLGAWLARSVAGSEDLFTDFYTEELGAHLPDAVRTAPAVTTALRHAATAAHDFVDVAAKLRAASDETGTIAALVNLGVKLAAYFVAMDELANAVTGAISAATVPDAPARAAAQAFAGNLAANVGEYVLVSGITDQVPELAFFLTLLGLLDWRRVAPTPGDPLSHDHVVKSLQLYRFKDLISDPGAHLANVHKWGRNDFDPEQLFRLFAGFFKPDFGVRVGVVAGDPFLRHG